MAKIYFRKYAARIESGEITKAQAITLAQTEVPTRWRAQVVAMLEEVIDQ